MFSIIILIIHILISFLFYHLRIPFTLLFLCVITIKVLLFYHTDKKHKIKIVNEILTSQDMIAVV